MAAHSTKSVELRYLAEVRLARRRRARRTAAVLFSGAAASGFLGTRMTDIGHATAFLIMAVGLVVGAAFVLHALR